MQPEMGVGGYDEDRGIVQGKDEPKGKYVGPMCPLLSPSNHNASTGGNKKQWMRDYRLVLWLKDDNNVNFM